MRIAMLLLAGGELLIEVESIESIRTLGKGDYNDHGQLVGASPFAEAGDYLTRVDLKSGHFHYVIEPMSEILERLQFLAVETS